MFYRWRSHRSSTLSTTPVLVGTMGLFAVLLATFLFCSHRISMPGTPIDLPRFANEEQKAVVKVVVTVTKDESLFLNAEKLKDTDDLGAKLAEAKKGILLKDEVKDHRVVFYADKDVSLGFIAKLFDIARGAEYNAYLVTSGDSLKGNTSRVSTQDDHSF